MLHLQVVGFPGRTYHRLQISLAGLADDLSPRAAVRFSPSLHKHMPQVATAERKQIRRNIQDGFTHIAAPPCRDFSSLYNEFQFDCRIIRLNIVDIIRSDWDEVRTALLSALDFEERWSSAIRPMDLHSPLLLPPPSFNPIKPLAGFWKNCDCYRDTSKINTANDLIQAVRSQHRRGKTGLAGHWVDSGSRQFVGATAMHARTPEERVGMKRYRFCYEIPSGFHFDVTHESGRRFTVLGHNRQEHRNVTRANIDSWGSIRNIA